MRPRSDQLRLIYLTASSPEEARRLADALVGERLAACVNILGAIESVYRWQGAVVSDIETGLLAKTTVDRVEAVSRRIAELHSYECPCVVSVPIDGGNPEFLKWISKNT